MKRKIKYIFVHCTASRQTWSVDALLKEFTNKGWHYPGYHWIVEANGKATQLMTEDLPSNGVKDTTMSLSMSHIWVASHAQEILSTTAQMSRKLHCASFSLS